MKPRRAFATAFAVTLLALLGAVVLLMTTHLRDQARRTTRDDTDAQLRQLLTAGAAIASDLPKAWSLTGGPQPQTLPVPIPPELAPRHAACSITVHPGPTPDTATAEIQSTCDSHPAHQTLHFTKDQSTWRLTSLDQN